MLMLFYKPLHHCAFHSYSSRIMVYLSDTPQIAIEVLQLAAATVICALNNHRVVF